MIRLVLAVVVGAALLASVAWSHAGPRSAAADPRLVAQSRAVAAGDTLVLRGRGFPRGARIALRAGPPRSEAVRIGGARTGRRGVFTARIRIRPHASAGRFVAVACHDRCRVKATVRFRIVAD